VGNGKKMVGHGGSSSVVLRFENMGSTIIYVGLKCRNWYEKGNHMVSIEVCVHKILTNTIPI